MQCRSLFLLLILIPCLAQGQGQKDFKYDYEVRGAGLPSTYSSLVSDTDLHGTSVMDFVVMDEIRERFLLPGIYISSAKMDTMIKGDPDGHVAIGLAPGIYSVKVQYLGYNTLTADTIAIKPNSKICLTVQLAVHMRQTYHIRSKRALSEKEQKEIARDRDRGRENELIKTKVCRVTTEI